MFCVRQKSMVRPQTVHRLALPGLGFSKSSYSIDGFTHTKWYKFVIELSTSSAQQCEPRRRVTVGTDHHGAKAMSAVTAVAPSSGLLRCSGSSSRRHERRGSEAHPFKIPPSALPTRATLHGWFTCRKVQSAAAAPRTTGQQNRAKRPTRCVVVFAAADTEEPEVS